MLIWNPLLNSALAQGEGAQGIGGMSSLVMIMLMFLVIYFLIIRPANKQRKDHQTMLQSLKKDDEVVTSGGIFGKIVSIDDRVAVLEISDKVKIKVLKDRIGGRWNPNQGSGDKAPLQNSR